MGDLDEVTMQRRAFLTTVGAGWLVQSSLPGRRPIEGGILGASHEVGHLLRGAAGDGPVEKDRAADVVIVGGGISGLSAAWRLRALGIETVLLELEPFVGGTSTFGEDRGLSYPWGAHYLAAPNPEARAALRLLDEMGALTGWDAAGRPRFDPKLLCHSPQERIFYEGAWHPGLVPFDALDDAALDELARFGDEESDWTERVGRDGLSAFQIPDELSSRDPEFLELDRMSMAEWMDRRGYGSSFLKWYVRYATLDDFGGEPEDISAWAGLHYFAARKLRSPELEGSHFLVWPEGNGRLVKELVARGAPRIVQNALVRAVQPGAQSVDVEYLDSHTGRRRSLRAKGVILATPGFVARRLVSPNLAEGIVERTASPWLVANIHLRSAVDVNLPWDSVLYDAEGLGYVDAQHQLFRRSEENVLTYYRAYGAADVRRSRQLLLDATWESLANGVLRDLAPAHPRLFDAIERMDVMIWGHAMPRPRPGFLGATPFEAPCLLGERVAFAHVDQSGIALFEEAQARGVRAAEQIAEAIGRPPGETWL